MMLTSCCQRDDVARCQALGIMVHLIKPITHAALRKAILRVLSTTVRPSVAAPVVTSYPQREPSRRLRILLAEDNVVNQWLVIRLLEKRGHTVVVVQTGRAALATLTQESFDLVLMDVHMPDMDGLQATAAIREQERTTGTHIPIIATTAHAMQGDKERCLAAGMDAYVSKPIRPEALFATIESAVTRRVPESRAPAVPVQSGGLPGEA